MGESDSTEMSDEVLAGKIKALQAVLAVMGVVVLGYLGFYGYLFVTDRFDAEAHVLGLVPMVMLFAVALPSWSNLVRLKSEQRSRR